MTWILLLYSPFRLKFEGSTVSQQSIVDSLMCNFVTRNVACLLTWLYTLTATTWVGVGRAKHNWTRQAQLDAPSTIGCTKHNWMHQAQLDAPSTIGCTRCRRALPSCRKGTKPCVWKPHTARTSPHDIPSCFCPFVPSLHSYYFSRKCLFFSSFCTFYASLLIVFSL